MLGFTESLRSLVSQAFSRARSSQALIFSDTQLAVLHIAASIPLQLRYCPALAKKPTKPSDNNEEQSKEKPFDPFDDPSPDLLIAAIPTDKPSHNLVLNKFPVIRDHFILATKENKPQTDLLEEDDLRLTYGCLQAWKENDDRRQHSSLFAFFNSGEHSGASQVHRHLQFLPIEAMEEGGEEAWDVLCASMTSPAHPSLPLQQNPMLPFLHFATNLNRSMTARDIHQRYQMLLRAGLTSMYNLPLDSLESVTISKNGKTTFSYNLALTTDIMAIMPRRSESSSIPDVSDSSVAINGTILAGTMMVKAGDEWNRLREKPELVGRIFYDIGFPPNVIKDKESL